MHIREKKKGSKKKEEVSSRSRVRETNAGALMQLHEVLQLKLALSISFFLFFFWGCVSIYVGPKGLENISGVLGGKRGGKYPLERDLTKETTREFEKLMYMFDANKRKKKRELFHYNFLITYEGVNAIS